MVAAKARGDIFGDHELETATGAGVRTLVLEGDAQNTALPSVVVNVAGGGSSMTAQQLSSAMTSSMMTNMDTDTSKAGLQMDISQLDDVLAGTQSLTVAGTVSTGAVTKSELIDSFLGQTVAGSGISIAAGMATAYQAKRGMTELVTIGTEQYSRAGLVAEAEIAGLTGTALDELKSGATTLGLGVLLTGGFFFALWFAGTLGKHKIVTEEVHVTNQVVVKPDVTNALGLSIADAIMAGGTSTIGHVPIDSGDVQTGVTNALTVQDVRVINAPGTSLTTGVTGSVAVINAPNTTLATSGATAAGSAPRGFVSALGATTFDVTDDVGTVTAVTNTGAPISMAAATAINAQAPSNSWQPYGPFMYSPALGPQINYYAANGAWAQFVSFTGISSGAGPNLYVNGSVVPWTTFGNDEIFLISTSLGSVAAASSYDFDFIGYKTGGQPPPPLGTEMLNLGAASWIQKPVSTITTTGAVTNTTTNHITNNTTVPSSVSDQYGTISSSYSSGPISHEYNITVDDGTVVQSEVFDMSGSSAVKQTGGHWIGTRVYKNELGVWYKLHAEFGN